MALLRMKFIYIREALDQANFIVSGSTLPPHTRKEKIILDEARIELVSFCTKSRFFIPFLRWANPGFFFAYFRLLVHRIILEVSRIQTRIIGVGGEDADH